MNNNYRDNGQREQQIRNAKAKKALDKLGSLPGMVTLKTQINQILQFSKVSKLRIEHGLKAEPHSNHMIFTGNPGTGKTTAARLIGEAFVALGLIKSSQEDIPFIEVHQADVAHPHVGQSERIVKEKFAAARGGVLFIDEAYALTAADGAHQRDVNIVAAIVQLMEDMRDELIVIAAGYPSEISDFLNCNPGLRSRFTNTIHFSDYSTPDLIKVASFICEEREYTMSTAFSDKLTLKIDQERLQPGFGNARTVRNILEQSIKRQSVRISKLNSPKKNDLLSLEGEDVSLEISVPVSNKEMLKLALFKLQKQIQQIELEETFEDLLA